MNDNTITVLVSEYEAMSQQGTVGFFEETVFFKLIEFYEKRGNLDKVLEVLDHALVQHSYSAILYIRTAQVLIENSQDRLALEYLDRASALAPSELDIYLLKAEALSNLGQMNQAFSTLNDLKTKTMSKKDLSEIYLFEALTYENQEEFSKMFNALKNAILANPENRVALERIWLSVELSGKYLESIELHEMLIDYDPYNHIAWYNLGHAFSACENHEKAADAFEYAFLIDEQFEFAYRECAKSCIELKDYKRALKCLNEVIEISQPDTEMLISVGNCYEHLNNVSLAKSFYLKAIKKDPFNSDVYYRLGECLMKEGVYLSAVTAYKKAVELDDMLEEYIAALAEAYYRIDNIPMADITFQKAVDTAPELKQYWIQYASFLIETKSYDKAEEIIEEGIVCAGGPELLYCQIACLLLMERKTEALHLLNRALIEHFNLHDSLYVLIPNLKKDIDVMAMISTYRPN